MSNSTGSNQIDPATNAAIEKVRQLVDGLIDERYNTKWNILRWLQSNKFNVNETARVLKKHLKWRKERRLDESVQDSLLQGSIVRRYHAPIDIVGPNRMVKADRLIVVDQAGKIDVNGLMKSVQPTEYLHEMYRVFEEIQRRIMKMEEEIDMQCYAHFIFDLDGLKFDPSLLKVVKGPFRVTWQLVAMNYREFIDKFIVINSPSFINVLWSAINQFIPDHSKNRIVFIKNDEKIELLHLFDKECLPEKYGGTLPNNQCLSEVLPVPKKLYWKPKLEYPSIEMLHKVSIPALKSRTLIYFIENPSTELLMFSQNDDDITITLYYSHEQNSHENEREIAVASIPKCGLLAMDLYDYCCENSGYYFIKLTNEASWILPSHYRLLVIQKGINKEIEPINSDVSWLKKGKKCENGEWKKSISRSR